MPSWCLAAPSDVFGQRTLEAARQDGDSSRTIGRANVVGRTSGVAPEHVAAIRDRDAVCRNPLGPRTPRERTRHERSIGVQAEASLFGVRRAGEDRHHRLASAQKNCAGSSRTDRGIETRSEEC